MSILGIKKALLSPLKHKRIVFMGTRGSSKTTALGCLALACDIKSASDKHFKHLIDEKTSGMRQVPSDLCAGYFPEPTPPGLIYEADVYLTHESILGEKTVCLPFCETAGEDTEKIIGPYQQSQYHQSMNWQDASNLVKYICDSNGYVLVAPVNRPNIPDIPRELLESEPETLRWDPDVNLARILSSIFRYKMQTRSPEIEGIAVLLTKYDTIMEYLKKKGMSLYDPMGATAFLQTYFRQTSGVLKHYGMEKVKFFPVHVEVEKVRRADGSVYYAQWPGNRGYKIALDYNRNLPLFSEQTFLALIDWIMETFS
jgi:hypothetical protein